MGFEPTTSCMPCKRSSQLSYIPVKKNNTLKYIEAGNRIEPSNRHDLLYAIGATIRQAL